MLKGLYLTNPPPMMIISFQTSYAKCYVSLLLYEYCNVQMGIDTKWMEKNMYLMYGIYIHSVVVKKYMVLNIPKALEKRNPLLVLFIFYIFRKFVIFSVTSNDEEKDKGEDTTSFSSNVVIFRMNLHVRLSMQLQHKPNTSYSAKILWEGIKLMSQVPL